MMIKFCAFVGAAFLAGTSSAVRLDTDLSQESFAMAYPEYNFAELDLETEVKPPVIRNETMINKLHQ